MKINISSPKTVTVELGRLEKACLFFAEKLMPSEIAARLELEIEFVPRESLNDLDGMCCNDDPDEVRPEFFTISLAQDLDDEDSIRVLAHEMVHVKQYALGELRDPEEGNLMWCGPTFGSSSESYWESPWEIEAYGREVGLVVMFKRGEEDEYSFCSSFKDTKRLSTGTK